VTNKVDIEHGCHAGASATVSGRAAPQGARHRPNPHDRRQFEQAIRSNEPGYAGILQAELLAWVAMPGEREGGDVASFGSCQDQGASAEFSELPWPGSPDPSASTCVANAVAELDLSDFCAAVREGLSSGVHCFEIRLDRLGPIAAQCGAGLSGGLILRLSARDARTARWLVDHRECLQTALEEGGSGHILLAVDDAAHDAGRT
jgi:hypothetical protein